MGLSRGPRPASTPAAGHGPHGRGPGMILRGLAASVRIRPGYWGWLANFLFCTLVGAAVGVAGGGDHLGASFVVSYAIGFSIHLCIHAGFVFLRPRVPLPVVITAMPILGMVLGLALGGMAIAGRPLYLLRGGYSAPILAVLFGALGAVGFALLYDLWAARGRLERAERDALARGKALAEAELRVLQAQMEPHFLFNTLANVISLIHTDPERAARLLEDLTALLRASLSRVRAGEATLGEELDLVRAYLDLQALRMDGRMTWDVRAAPELEGLRLPPLLVQPLVENAVLHGVEPAVGGGRVEVHAERAAGGAVRIRVLDDGAGLDPDRAAGAGECIANVRDRLRALFEDRGRLALTELPGGGVSAEIVLPAAEPEEAGAAAPASGGSCAGNGSGASSRPK